jgi:hypothetical protein
MGSRFVVNGARADASNVLIDGINDQTPRDASAQAQPPLEALQEFKLLTSDTPPSTGAWPAAWSTWC